MLVQPMDSVFHNNIHWLFLGWHHYICGCWINYSVVCVAVPIALSTAPPCMCHCPTPSSLFCNNIHWLLLGWPHYICGCWINYSGVCVAVPIALSTTPPAAACVKRVNPSLLGQTLSPLPLLCNAIAEAEDRVWPRKTIWTQSGFKLHGFDLHFRFMWKGFIHRIIIDPPTESVVQVRALFVQILSKK